MDKELWDFVVSVIKPLWLWILISLIIHLVCLSRINVLF